MFWDILGLYGGIIDGLRVAGHSGVDVASVGVDTWAVDYGLLDERGNLMSNPVHYRDARGVLGVGKVLAEIGVEELYGRNGVQMLPINTIFQLAAAAAAGELADARTLLLIPDLISYWLTGSIGAELTNASTTQLLSVDSRQWDTEMMGRLGIDASLFPALHAPGHSGGALVESVRADTGLGTEVTVVAVGTHDTASAVVGVPATDEYFAYLSCGTWSLLGVELAAPVLSETGRLANFTNELGVDATVRYLRNVMGLWLLQQSMRTWDEAGLDQGLDTLLGAAANVAGLVSVFDPDGAEFLAPGDMPSRIAAECRRTAEPVPTSPEQFVRCILDSLALAYRRTLHQAMEITGHDVRVLHLVGGGVNNTLLCQLTADACEVPVVAGPVEAAAIGNLVVQARTGGALGGDLAALRSVIARSCQLVTYSPRGDNARWWAAEQRLRDASSGVR